MLSRMLAILISSWLPVLGVILPISEAHRTNALVAGIAATVLAGFSLVDRRARFGAALVSAWVALFPFLGMSSLLEVVTEVTWGVVMFSWLIGPFSEEPHVMWTKTKVLQPKKAPAPEARPMPATEMPHAA